MSIPELKAKVATYQALLKEKDGCACLYNENGPPSMSLIWALVNAVNEQELRIDDLRRRMEALERMFG